MQTKSLILLLMLISNELLLAKSVPDAGKFLNRKFVGLKNSKQAVRTNKVSSKKTAKPTIKTNSTIRKPSANLTSTIKQSTTVPTASLVDKIQKGQKAINPTLTQQATEFIGMSTTLKTTRTTKSPKKNIFTKLRRSLAKSKVKNVKKSDDELSSLEQTEKSNKNYAQAAVMGKEILID